MKDRKKNALAGFLGVVWGFLILGYIIYIVTLFTVESEYYYKPENSLPLISQEKYGSLLTNVTSARTYSLRVENDPDYTELFAVTDYIEAAFLMKAYEEAGDVEMTFACRKIMDKATQKMGDLAFTAEKIDEALK